MTDRATGASKNATRGRGPAGPLRVFVSYRRDDVPDATHRLVEHLEQRFGKQGVFLDVDRIPAGRPFAQVISEWVTECKVFLVIIGHNWPGTRNERGIPRIKGAGDFVRLEVEAALAAGVAVIPVLIEDAPVPAVEDLPESMAALPSLQAFKLTRDHWSIDVERLERTMEAIAGIPEAHSLGGRRRTRASLPAIAIVVAIVIAVVGSIAAAVALLVNPTTKPTAGTNVTKVGSPPSRQLAATTPATATKSTNSGGLRTSTSTSAPSSPATSSTESNGTTSPATGGAGSNRTISSATHGAGSNGTTTSINAANNASDGEAATATTSTSTRPTSVSAAATLSPEQVVSRYWDDIGTHPHRFGAAYGYFDAWYKQHRESRETFIGTHKKAKIKEVKFRGKTVSKSGSKATVQVLFLLTDDAMYGCWEWEGHYAMTYEGRWLINEAILEHIHRCGG